MEFSSSQFDDQDVFHVSDLFSLHFCIFVGCLNFKKKLCEGSIKQMKNKDSIKIYQRIDAEWSGPTQYLTGRTFCPK